MKLLQSRNGSKKKDNSFHSLQVWCYRFLKRNSYGIRPITHIGQKLKESCKQEYADFFTNLYRLRFNIGDIDDYSNIFNMDETPICFEMIARTTVEKIGEKSVNVRSFGSDRNRITVFLCIGANGYKAPPLLIFKGKKGAKKELELRKNFHVQNKRIYVLCQENSWADSQVFQYWLENIFFNNKHINNSLKKILILDRATSHYDPDLVSLFKKIILISF